MAKQIADILYPSLGRTVEQEPTAPKPFATDEVLGAKLYPEQGERYARQNDADDGAGGKQTEVVLRDTSGAIIERLPYGNDPVQMACSRNNRLTHADLEGLNFRDASLPRSRMAHANLSGARFHGSLADSVLTGADCRGTSFKNCDLTLAELSGIEVDGETDLTNANLEGVPIDDALMGKLQQCRGWKTAKGLRLRDRRARA